MNWIPIALCYAAITLAGQQEKKTMTQHATGPFEVKLVPQATEPESPLVGRMKIDKKFHGALEATSFGQMIAMSTTTKGSAGYVAIEIVDGTLNGRKGTFALQHSGVMNRGNGEMIINVIPDSGTGELTGLTGSMNIRIEPGGKHFYDFNYELPENPR